MNRLLVALLAAVDALIASAVGVAVALAPLTVFWVLALGGTADWGALWPASVRVWQLGQLVPLEITLPPEYLTATGIPADAATFWLSLAPLAFAGFTAVFAARSGARAARAGAWIIGVLAGTAVTAAVAWLLWRTSGNPIAAVYGWQALVLPTAVFALPALAGAIVGAWRQGDDGLVDDLRDRADARGAGVAEASARGVGIAALGFVGVGALVVAVATIARGAEIIALFEAAHVDVGGAIMIALGQLAYLPTLVVWGGSFAAGPGFSLGVGTTVSPAGTTLGVLPGIPAFGVVPETSSQWMLLSVLLLVAVGFIAGAAARARLARATRRYAAHEASGPRVVALIAIVVGGGALAALLSAVASGSLGPGRLAEVGPAPGPVAFAVGVELLVGAAIALFSPTRSSAMPTSTLDAGEPAPAPERDADTHARWWAHASAPHPPSADAAVPGVGAVATADTAAVGSIVGTDALDEGRDDEARVDAASLTDDDDTQEYAATELDPLAGLPDPDPGPDPDTAGAADRGTTRPGGSDLRD